MARIRRIELSEILAELPDIQPFDPKKEPTRKVDDLFLCALGFEDRCLTMPRLLSEADYGTGLAVYFTYSTNPDDNEKNRPPLVRYLEVFAETTQHLESDTVVFVDDLRSLLEKVSQRSADRLPRVTFDISVAANRLLLRTMKVLLEFDIELSVLYSEAAVYHPTKEEYDEHAERWPGEGKIGLERGVGGVAFSRDHPGVQLDTLPDCIILFPTFKRERCESMIDKVDPSLLTNPGRKVRWLLGSPHLQNDNWRLPAMRDINRLTGGVPAHEVSTFFYKQTPQTLDAIHREMSDNHNISISPVGAKMQALGTSLFCYLHPDVRVLLATPDQYNAAQYSEGCRDTWRIEFGSIPDLRERLNRVGTLVIED